MYREGYGSEFDDGGDTEHRKRKHDKIGYYDKPIKHNYHSSQLPSKSQCSDNYEREQQRLDFAKFNSLNAYDRHRKLVHDYLKYYGGKIEDFATKKTNYKTDYDIIEENHQFVWDEDGEGDNEEKSWGQRLAKKYYDKLFKEYCISDVSRYKLNQFAMRWRTENEVHIGKGQFSCGARKCEEKKELKTWEVNFAYIEHGEKKNTLIKLRLCPDCSYKLNYHKKHKQVNKKKKERKKSKNKKKKKRRKSEKEHSDTSSSDSDEEEGTTNKDGGIEVTHGDDSEKEESSIWKKPVEKPIEKSKDELFDEYLEDLFM